MKGLILPVMIVGVLGIAGILIGTQLQNRQSTTTQAGYTPNAKIECAPRFFKNDPRNKADEYYVSPDNRIRGEITFDELKKDNFTIVVLPGVMSGNNTVLTNTKAEGQYYTNRLMAGNTIDSDYNCKMDANKFLCSTGQANNEGIPEGAFRVKLTIPGGAYANSNGRAPVFSLGYSVNSDETPKTRCATETLKVILRPPV